ncbi:hypothetical protein BC940DRAFT_296077 [Gongronella butleri]|nr:hypothetical protein BC940DRAFT_296077 [Gongronella butleri]
MTDDDLILQRLLDLTNELSLQGQSNQSFVNALKAQMDDYESNGLQAKDTLDFDADDLIPELVPENLASTDDHASSTLVSNHIKLLDAHHLTMLRNKELENECRELQLLVKDYESSLELVASKLRAYAMTSYEGQLQLQREYEALLNAEKDITASLFMENTLLQSQLVKLSESLRAVYNQDTDATPNDRLHQLTIENQGLRELLRIAQQKQQQPLPPSPPIPTSSKQQPVQIAKATSRVVDEYFRDA